MEHLWAPWRNHYITKGTENPAELFLRIGQSGEDERYHVVLRGKSFYALLNAYPYNLGHMMIVPYRKMEDIDSLSDDELLEMMSMTKRLKAALTAAFQPHGFNIGLNLGAAAGAGICEHLHIHLVPRWDHDANFMTPIAETRIHPGDLDTVYRQILNELGRTAPAGDPPKP